ncbi:MULTISPECIES: flavodoxin family protein [Intestinimonas]|jgi:multimeric flavodoxin WrbA|uniref:Iron-sulfur flavoprotein n=1 Tax=Intestinimonas butyriciproducens TaxID=1297617 RepID=A0A0S2W799_9FIRM|nr:flavodoxin family protein [Intestinimonas butyriciproducens]ALP95122.1 iron-sulfur flavoprotein [Intestinimonas butyriciproducens]MDB7817629.1 flavodoxin family protein [Intestinimonas butyriciproducens]MDB7844346.1 flavodoxin family protein [Intestinimonas butyriciproducens]MDB7858827.1 flavodoxin family protein [Intestinimonas butyriciproducens]
MSKKVLILSGSPRKGGNSDLLCDEFLRGAQESGNQVEKVFLRSKKVAPCNACYYCKNSGGKCAIPDDMAEILDKMQAADVIVMASPVYFYSIGAQMKAVIDRSVARWTNIPNKEFYYIMTAAEDSDTVMDCTLECFRGFAACLDGAQEKGVIYGKGVYEAGAIKGLPAMREAYEMGKQV